MDPKRVVARHDNCLADGDVVDEGQPLSARLVVGERVDDQVAAPRIERVDDSLDRLVGEFDVDAKTPRHVARGLDVSADDLRTLAELHGWIADVGAKPQPTGTGNGRGRLKGSFCRLHVGTPLLLCCVAACDALSPVASVCLISCFTACGYRQTCFDSNSIGHPVPHQPTEEGRWKSSPSACADAGAS